jgi:hypothetical protein
MSFLFPLEIRLLLLVPFVYAYRNRHTRVPLQRLLRRR